MSQSVDDLKQRYRNELTTHDRYLVVFLTDNGSIGHHMICNTQDEVKTAIANTRMWLVFGKYDFKDNPRVGTVLILSDDTSALRVPIQIRCEWIDMTLTGTIILDTGATYSIVKVTAARRDVLMSLGAEHVSPSTANGSAINCYRTGATITLDNRSIVANLLCSSEINESVFGLDHIQRCVISMVSGRVGVAWAGDAAP